MSEKGSNSHVRDDFSRKMSVVLEQVNRTSGSCLELLVTVLVQNFEPPCLNLSDRECNASIQQLNAASSNPCTFAPPRLPEVPLLQEIPYGSLVGFPALNTVCRMFDISVIVVLIFLPFPDANRQPVVLASANPFLLPSARKSSSFLVFITNRH